MAGQELALPNIFEGIIKTTEAGEMYLLGEMRQISFYGVAWKKKKKKKSL
jgi:hypothetical protein